MPAGLNENSYEEVIDWQKGWEFDHHVFPQWRSSESLVSIIQIPQIAFPLSQLPRNDSVIGSYDPVDRDIELLSKRVMKYIDDSEMNDNSG